MCGICGEISFDNTHASAEAIRKMSDALATRGPDGAGMFIQKNMGFGQRRLKIIDPTEHAQQPMIDNELGLGIVYNGAIYNYPELKKQLRQKGYRFFSNGDTEVLLKAYHAWGEQFVERLNGMFAFAIWERDSGRVLIGRDRLGIKPFYYHKNNNRIRFASTLPALVAGGEISTDIDPVALHHYMTFHSVVPPPRTLLKSVKKLPPATMMRIEPDGTTKQKRYWKLNFETNGTQRKVSANEWQEKILAALRKAVDRRMIADVPVGVLLSGGLDSSLVVGLLAKAGQQGLQTFSIGFESIGRERGDEFEYSNIIAEHFATDHRKIFIDSSCVLPELRHCVHAMSEPMVSHDNIGFYLLSQEVSKHVKVVQSGQGADEVFAGYHWYPSLLDSNNAARDYAKVFFDRDHEEFAQAVQPDFVQENHSEAFVAAYFDKPYATRAIDKALGIDINVMLVDDPVKRVDNMTMAWGLEARVPFLDHELVELAAQIPAELKVKDGGKYILKEAARSVIPAAVIDRPKGYFPVPALKYLRGEFLDFVRKVLDRPTLEKRGIFQPKYIEKLIANPDAHLTPLRGSKLWQAALLEYWLQAHGY